MRVKRMNKLAITDLVVGDCLPVLVIDISATLIVAGALASRDYQDVHHDKARAQVLGSSDIFMNILTYNGLIGRYISDWMGPGGRLQKVVIKLGAPNYPGDQMILSGVIEALNSELRSVVIAVRGRNRLGDHVTGTVTVALPVAV